MNDKKKSPHQARRGPSNKEMVADFSDELERIVSELERIAKAYIAEFGTDICAAIKPAGVHRFLGMHGEYATVHVFTQDRDDDAVLSLRLAETFDPRDALDMNKGNGSAMSNHIDWLAETLGVSERDVAQRVHEAGIADVRGEYTLRPLRLRNHACANGHDPDWHKAEFADTADDPVIVTVPCSVCDEDGSIKIYRPTTMNTTTKTKTTARTKKAKQTLVIIAWIDEYGAADSVSTLGYNNGKGGIRVYEKDNYDGRVDLGCPPGEKRPYFENAQEALLWMSAHRDQQIQLSVSAARELGFSAREMSEL